jgi:hypothetical protein
MFIGFVPLVILGTNLDLIFKIRGGLVMPNVYVIMGEAGAKKSSTVRALTGAYKSKSYDVGTSDKGVMEIFVQIRSLQEFPIGPQDFIDFITDEEADNVLLTLRINRANRRPEGYIYLERFLMADWNIRSVIILNEREVPQVYPPQLPRPILINNTAAMAANTIASRIRGRWLWL